MTDKITEERVIKLSGIAHVDFYFAQRSAWRGKLSYFGRRAAPAHEAPIVFIIVFK